MQDKPKSVIRAFDYTFHVVFISLSIRFRSPAGILPIVLLYHNPLHLQQTDNPSVRPSNETDSESNDRFGINDRLDADRRTICGREAPKTT